MKLSFAAPGIFALTSTFILPPASSVLLHRRASTDDGRTKKGDKQQHRGLSGKKSKNANGSKSSKRANSPNTLVCFSDFTTSLTAAVETDDGEATDTQSVNDILDFGVITVGKDGSDLLIDLTATTGGVFQRGYFDRRGLSDYANFNFNSHYHVNLGFQIRPGCTNGETCTGQIISPVPQAVVRLDMVEDEFNIDQDDWDIDDGLWQIQKRTRSHSAKFMIPDLAEGDYLIQIIVDLEARATITDATDEYLFESDTIVTLGPHFIMASVVDTAQSVCPSLF